MTKHVVFGTGQIGRHVVTRLLDRGDEVVAVNRSATGRFGGTTIVAGDATDIAFTTAACAGADVVYFCLNATDYRLWATQFPPLQRGVLHGARSADARLVVLDNLYAYGPPHGRRLVETMAAHPTSSKAATRAAMTEELLRAHLVGDVEVAVGRASDYFGPGVTASALGETVFAPALTGSKAQVMGDPDTPHSYSYAPDVADGLITLGTASDATGQVWHLPVAPPITTRELIARAYEQGGHRLRVLAAGRTMLRLIGVVKPELREYLHTLYQFADPWVVDDSKFRAAFTAQHTPLDKAIASTLAWYSARADHTTGATP